MKIRLRDLNKSTCGFVRQGNDLLKMASRSLACFAVLICFSLFINIPAIAQPIDENSVCTSCACDTTCQTATTLAHENISGHTELEMDHLRTWIVDTWFYEQGGPFKQVPHALALMTTQLTTMGIQQMQIIGSFFDAKHQMETQRLFQQLTAQAHKDYHPSEGLCEIGTATTSLAQSQRIADLTQMALTKRTMDRTMNSRWTMGGLGEVSDRLSRIDQFTKVYCNPEDNASGLKLLCGEGGGIKERHNLDVDFTSTLENKLTLDLDMSTGGAPVSTPDEEDVLALNANLMGNVVNTPVPFRTLGDALGNMRDAMNYQIGQRSIAAKRSVAQNSLSALTAMRASGSGESAPFLKAAVHELGVGIPEIEPYLGESPSYFAQMEVLTKKLYQNPAFYADLYDKPVNIERKGVAMQAIGIMQDRDIYDSLIRSEAVLATLLESLIQKEHERVSRNLATIRDMDEMYEYQVR